MPFPKRPPTFALPVGDKGLQNLEDLQNYFLVDDILRHFQSGKLHTWCQDRRYNEQLDKLYEIPDNSTRTEIVKKLIFIFNIKTIMLSPSESVDADAYIKSNGQVLSKEAIIKEFLDNPNNIEKIVFDYLAVKENQAKVKKQLENKNSDAEFTEYDEYYQALENLNKSYEKVNSFGDRYTIKIGTPNYVPYLKSIDKFRVNLKNIVDNFLNNVKTDIAMADLIENVAHKMYNNNSYRDATIKERLCEMCKTMDGQENNNLDSIIYKFNELQRGDKYERERRTQAITRNPNWELLFDKYKAELSPIFEEIFDLFEQIGFKKQ